MALLSFDKAGPPTPGARRGNDIAGVSGGNDLGAGIALEPAVIFGTIAARHMAGSEDR